MLLLFRSSFLSQNFTSIIKTFKDQKKKKKPFFPPSFNFFSLSFQHMLPAPQEMVRAFCACLCVFLATTKIATRRFQSKLQKLQATFRSSSAATAAAVRLLQCWKLVKHSVAVTCKTQGKMSAPCRLSSNTDRSWPSLKAFYSEFSRTCSLCLLDGGHKLCSRFSNKVAGVCRCPFR